MEVDVDLNGVSFISPSWRRRTEHMQVVEGTAEVVCSRFVACWLDLSWLFLAG